MALTRRQREVLEFIRDHIIRKGASPTVREVAEHFGFRSPLSAKLHIDALVRKGYLKKRPFLSRGLEIPGLLPKESVRLPWAQ
jgi:repressor LexA